MRKCSVSGPCLEQIKYDIANEHFNIIADCCGFCGENLQDILDQLPEDEEQPSSDRILN